MASDGLQQLSTILRRERERSGMTVRQLADMAGVTASTVSRIETGFIASPRPDLLQRLASALQIEVEDLYATADYLIPASLPGLRPYLRAKYGIGEAAAGQIEGYVDALRQRGNQSTKEGQHDSSGDTNP